LRHFSLAEWLTLPAIASATDAMADGGNVLPVRCENTVRADELHSYPQTSAIVSEHSFAV
jgi:hypothetical protein